MSDISGNRIAAAITTGCAGSYETPGAEMTASAASPQMPCGFCSTVNWPLALS